ncbi:hypothetical protein HY622_00945 [Candidatus Uhrbacteria bacterium]|nr:hypothetical protein [Candidatus Uhrbacteria bacterium]
MLTRKRSFIIAALVATVGCKADISTSGVRSIIDSVQSAAPAAPVTSSSPCATATDHSSPSPAATASPKTAAPTPFKLLFNLTADSPEGFVVSKGDPIVVGRWEIKSTHDVYTTEYMYRLDRSSRVNMNVEFDVNGEVIFAIPATDVIYESFYPLVPYVESLIKANETSMLTAKVRNFQNLPVDVRIHMDITGIRFAGATIDPAVDFASGKSVNIAVILQ